MTNPYDSETLETGTPITRFHLPPNPAIVRRATRIALIFLVASNLLATVIAWRIGDWEAVFVLGFIAPIVNVLQGLLGLILLIVVKQDARGAPVLPYVLAGVVAPFLAVPLDIVCLKMMDISVSIG